MIPPVIPVDAWEPAVLATAWLVGEWLERRRGRAAVPGRERLRDLLSLVLALAVSAGVRALGPVPAPGPVRGLPIAVALVAFDLFLYGLHRLGHGAGWRIHVAHHAPAHFSASMSLRDSVVHLALFAAAFVGLARLLGLGREEAALVSSVLLGFQVWTHVGAWVALGPLDWVLIGPRHHAMHHATPMLREPINLGGLLCVWDQLFGTYRHPPRADPTPRTWPRRHPPRLRAWIGV